MAHKQSVALLTALVLSMVATSLALVTYRDVLGEEWKLYKLLHKKNYTDEAEDGYRFRLFLIAKERAALSEQAYIYKLETWFSGLNQFSDLMSHELPHSQQHHDDELAERPDFSRPPVISVGDVLKKEWSVFKLKFNKTYTGIEDKYRFKLFLETKHQVAKHNQRHSNGLVSYRLAANRFADMTNDEFTRAMNGYRPNWSLQAVEGQEHPDVLEELRSINRSPEVELPKSVDWRQHGHVTPVKDQGHCGSCWAFSSTGALEGQHFRRTGDLISLSEQNLVDCSRKYGNMGCEGGLMANAFKYIRDNHGVDTENSYPYEAHDDRCRFKNKTVGADDKGYVEIPSGNEKKLVQAIAMKGPISVAIDASQDSFRLYDGGVYDEPACGNKEENLDHGVLVVGYGTDPVHGDYYLVKNSWSETWGQSGYIKMARNKDNQCGIATSAVYPVV